jgi:hypothetical protein
MGSPDLSPTFKYSNITGAGPTTIKTGPGTLHTITIGTGAAGTVTVYDNTAASGTIITSFTLTTTSLATLILDVGFNVGLTVAGVAATNLTFSYV